MTRIPSTAPRTGDRGPGEYEVERRTASPRFRCSRAKALGLELTFPSRSGRRGPTRSGPYLWYPMRGMTREPSSADLATRLRSFVGQPMGDGPASGPDPVNQPMIRHWAVAFEDRNLAYVDAAWARTSRFGGVVSPPVMLQTWTWPSPKVTGIAERGGSPVETDDTGPLAILDAAGFVATLASNSEFEIERYVRLGEDLSSTTVIESISEEKQTRLGPGHFVTWVTTWRDNDEVVGRQRFRILKFKPEPAPS